MLYVKHGNSGHSAKGKRDGIKVASIYTPIGNF